MDLNSKRVILSFFQPFYESRIENVIQLGKEYRNEFDLGLLNFWFSVLDFYGGIYYIGSGKSQYYNDGNLKLTSSTSFSTFIKEFFPSPYNQLGKFIYTIYRSGIVHQISPKKGGIVWDNENQKMLWIEVDNSIKDENKNKIAILNIAKFSSFVACAFYELKRRIENDEMINECNQICKMLIDPHDSLRDEENLNEHISKLDKSLKSELFIYKNS